MPQSSFLFKPNKLVLATRCAIVFLGISPTAYGQQADSKQSNDTLPVVVVKDTKDESSQAVQGYVPKRTTTATKTDTPVIEIPQSISVIGRDEMEARGVQTVTEAMRYVPGVISEVYPDERGFDWFYIRGFDAQATSDFRDGLRQAGSGGFALPRTEAYGIERIEVLRGPSSVVFGQGDAGGIINRVSKHPTLDQINEVQATIGSFNRRQVAFDVGGNAKDKQLLYRLVGVGMSTDGQLGYSNGDEITNKRFYLAPSLTWQSADTSFTLLTDVLRNRTDNFGFEAATANEVTGILVGEPSFNKFNQDQGSIGYQFEHRFNEEWRLKQNLRAGHTEIDFYRVNAAGLQADGHTLDRTTAIFEEKVNQIAVDTSLQGNFRTGNINHQALFGVDYIDTYSKLRWRQDAAPSLDLLDPVYGQSIIEPTTEQSNYGQKMHQLGIYTQDQIKFTPQWLLTIGGRYDTIKQDTNDHLNSADTNQRDQAFSGRAGLTYLTEFGLAPYISYAESFLPQSGIAADGSTFDPTRGKQYEIGAKYQPKGTNALFTVALFDLRKKNVQTPDPDPINAGNGFFVAAGEIKSRGIELEGKAELIKGLNLSAQYTYTDVKVTKSNDVDLGKRPVYIPKEMASLWIDYVMQSGKVQGLGFGAGARYVGRRFNDAENLTSTPSYTVYDAAIHYQTGPWRFGFNAANLTNKKYLATCAYGECARGIERSFIATATYRW